MPVTSVAAPGPRGSKRQVSRETDGVLRKRVQARGLCVPEGAPTVNAERDPWFPSDRFGAAAKAAARSACRGCPVQRECLELALREERAVSNVWGVRGGRSVGERQQMVARRAARGGGVR
jgi:hypothetical protein